MNNSEPGSLTVEGGLGSGWPLSDPYFVQALVASMCTGGSFTVFMLILAVVCVYCRCKKDRGTKNVIEKPATIRTPVVEADPLSKVVVLSEKNQRNATNKDAVDKIHAKKGFDLKKMIGQALAKQVESMLIDKSRLTIGSPLGEGNFGVVYRGNMTDKSHNNSQPVAVKVISGNSITGEDMSAFIEEILRMRLFNHKHVLSTLGLVIERNMPQVIMPYMENGDLRNYVANPNNMFDCRDLADIGLQVAEGMVYLGSQGFIHRDLAARNCMVNSSKVIKVADFGLSRDIFNTDYYMAKRKTLLPIRWMALESLKGGKFSVKSDIWSFGILLWELFTRGTHPYPGLDNDTVIAYIKKGERMKAPEYAPDDMYVLMRDCWHTDPEKRPTFRDITESLQRLIHGSSLGVFGHADYQNTLFN